MSRPWPMAAVALVLLAAVAGVAVQLQQPRLWPAAAHGGLLAVAVLATAGAWAARHRSRPALVLAMLAAAAVAFASTGWRAAERLAQRLPAALEGRDLRVTGVVAQMTQPGPSGTRFVFEVDSARDAQGPVTLPPRLALGWYRGWHDEASLADPRAELAAGQRWELPLRLRRPQGLMNPEGFDLELWLFERDLHATGYVRATDSAAPPRRLADGVGHPVERLRQHLRTRIQQAVPDARVAGVLAALVVGDQGAIERSDWEIFRLSGVAHLMSISGLHVTMFAWGAGLVIAALWRRSPRALRALPAPVAARWGGLAVAALYALLAGWGVPAQRTVCMLAGAAALRSLGLAWPWPLVLLAAAVAVLALDPWALLQPGFWLSFGAVGLLMLSEPAQGEAPAPGWRGWLRAQLKAQAVATLGLAPLAMVFFQQVSVVGALANLVAIPLVTLVVTPLALAGCVLPGLWALAAVVVQALVGLLAWLAAWPGAVWTAAAAPAWAIAAGLLGAALGVLPLPWRLRALAVPLVLPLLWPRVDRPPEGRFELLAADVGQGTAVLVRTAQHALLYDAGPQYSPESDAGQRVLLPLLRARGEQRLAMLLLSHRDTDHVGGAVTLLAALPVGDMLSSLEPWHPLLARAGAPPHRRCDAGQRWAWDGVRFEILHPAADDHEALRLRPNALSCVLRVVDAQGRAALLTGDIEAAQEAALAAREGAALASEVLMAPHHGSRTSSSEALLAAVRPRMAVVQAAYRSRFGHPAPEVLARYAAHGIAVVRTDTCGAWAWRSDEAGSQGRCTRTERRRYWHAG